MNSNVIAAWNKCQPCQQIISGKLCITWYFSPFEEAPHWTTESKVYVIGTKNTVTNRGTSLARIIKGHVNLNLFFENE